MADTIALGWGLPAGQMLHTPVGRMSRRSVLCELDLSPPRIRGTAVRPPR